MKAALFAGGCTSAMIGVGDISSGTNTSDMEYIVRVTTSMVVAVVTYGLRADFVSKWLKRGMENAVKYVLASASTGFLVGGFESGIRQLVQNGEIDWDRLFSEARFAGVMAGLSATLEYALYMNTVVKTLEAEKVKLPTKDELNENLQEWSRMQKTLAPSKTKASDFNTAAIVYDARTGEYYYGMNKGIVLSGDTLNSELIDILPQTSLNQYKIGNCAEVDAVNQALTAGSNLSDLYIYTIDTTQNAFGVPKFACENCTYAFKGNVSALLSGYKGE